MISAAKDEPITLDELVSDVAGVRTRDVPSSGEKNNLPVRASSDRLWTSIRHWAEYTTFHGIRNIFDEQTSLIRRGFWLIITLSVLIATVWVCQDQLNRFLSYKTLTEDIFQYPDSIPFPAVTICSYNLVRNASVTDERERTLLRELYVKRMPNKTNMVEELGTTFLNNVSLRRILDNNSVTADETFYECLWEGKIINCSNLIRKITPVGHCFSFNSEEDDVTSDMLRVTRLAGSRHGLHVTLLANHNSYFIHDDLSVGFKVMVHEPKEYPDVDNAIAVAPGFTYYISLTKHEFVYLPRPVLAFGDQECYNGKTAESSPEVIDAESSPEVNNKLYTAHYCLQRCRVQYVHARCGCIGPLDEGDMPECNPIQIVDCYMPVLDNFSMFTPDCYCPVPCEVTEYKTKVSSAMIAAGGTDIDGYPDATREDILQLRIFYGNKVIKKHEQVLAVTFEDLWGNYGGFLGIAVGASIVTFIEVGELLLVNGIYYIQTIRNLARDK